VTTHEAVSAAVERLSQAQATRVPCAPVRDLIGTDDLAAAYAVQQELVRARLAAGATVVGRKIGATSEAVQNQLGVDQPDFGYLLDEMDVSRAAVDGGGSISMRTLLQPRVEAEVAFRLGRDIDVPEDEITLELVRDAVEVALPALEIVDSRIADWKIGFTDTVADCASSALFVVGTDAKPLGSSPGEVEVGDVVGELVDGAPVGDGLLQAGREVLRVHQAPTRIVIGPSRSNSARKTSPGVMGTAACSAPVMIR
jgi:2-keto-4-pentenoate hydratase